MTEPPAQGDAELVRRLVAGDGQAWAVFVDRHAPLLVGMARRMLLRRTGRAGAADVDEIVAEVFLMLLRRERALLARYDPTWRLSTWLGVLCRTAVHRHVRRRRPVVHGADPGAVDGAAGPADRALGRELREAVRSALEGLEARDRVLLHLRYLEGLDHAAIALAVGVEPGSVGPLLKRARERLAGRAPELERLLEDAQGSAGEA